MPAPAGGVGGGTRNDTSAPSARPKPRRTRSSSAATTRHASLTCALAAGSQVVQRINQRLKLDSRFTATLDEDEEDALAEGLGLRLHLLQEEAAAALQEGQEEPPQLAPVHPEDLLSLLSAYLHEAAGERHRGVWGASTPAVGVAWAS